MYRQDLVLNNLQELICHKTQPNQIIYDLINNMKCSLFQATVMSMLLYGCTTWTLTKRMEKKLDGNYTRML